ncbi:M14 family zinc carboxypeptidase [Salsipaludibacter albus]|uniref:M14 family zinc carboxypeptidase n=1 Tax=Salsipaludibacter albus TaxID=2849650 RepID=UPI001EE3BF08|nr:M14 family zinc carboxypeptidase [Salsipaludibacter albus]
MKTTVSTVHPTVPRRARRIAIPLVLAMLATLVTLTSATDAVADSPNSACGNLDDPSAAGWTSHEELGKKLATLDANSKGRVDVEVIGHSNRGREIWSARVGTGDRVMLVTSEIHGNEKTGTEALLQMLRTVASGGNAEVEELLEGVTIVAVPKFNPDGGELNRRQSDYPWSEVMEDYGFDAQPDAWYYSAFNQGFDVNRDFAADLTYEPDQADMPGEQELAGFYITPEARALRDLYVDLTEEFGIVDTYLDLHHKGPCDQVNDEFPALVTVDEPSSAAGIYEVAGASFGPDPTKQGISGDAVLADDGSAAPTEACGPLVDFPAGSIAVVDRGTCGFTTKVANAQAAGAIGVIVVNDRPGLPTNLGGNDDTITIPAVQIGQDAGEALKDGLPATVSIESNLGQYVTVALDHPPLGSDAAGNPRYAEYPLLDQDASKRAALAAALGIQDHAGHGQAESSPFYGGVAQYLHPQTADGYSFDRDYAGQARSAFALNGSATVLFEVRGQSNSWGQKKMGQLTQIVEAGLFGVAERMADGSIDDLDPDDFYLLPKYW